MCRIVVRYIMYGCIPLFLWRLNETSLLFYDIISYLTLHLLMDMLTLEVDGNWSREIPDDDWKCWMLWLLILLSHSRGSLGTDVVDCHQVMMWFLNTYIFSWVEVLNRSSYVIIRWFDVYCLVCFFVFCLYMVFYFPWTLVWLDTTHTLWVLGLHQMCGAFVPSYLLLFEDSHIVFVLNYLPNH